MQGKRGLGEDITRKLAVDALQQEPAMQTFGPTGDNAWDAMLAKPPTARPPTAPRRMEGGPLTCVPPGR